jgi:REP element-mobilizing transposase RayT
MYSWGAQLRYSPAEVVKVLKSLTGRGVLGDGYYVWTVGSEVTATVIREYIKKQGQGTHHKSYEQLKLF